MFTVNGDGGLLIDPELIAYASVQYDYNNLDPSDQVRLNILRLEILRIRIEVQSKTFNLQTQSENIHPNAADNHHLFLLRSMLLENYSSYDVEKVLANHNIVFRRIATMIDSQMRKKTYQSVLNNKYLTSNSFHLFHFQIIQYVLS